MRGDMAVTQRAATTSASTAKPVILCVEDEPDLLADIGDELAASGYAPLLAADGMEALNILEGHSPDLVLCDITMPRLGGYELLKTLRAQRPDLADVPFIFLTALADREDVISAKCAGVDDYLVKPVDYDLMLASIDARLRQVARMKDKFGRDAAGTREAIKALPGGDAVWSGAAARTLDFIALGVVLLDADGRVVFANRAASAFYPEVDGLSVGRQMELRERGASKRMRTNIAEAARAGTSDKEFVAGLPLKRDCSTHDVLALVCSLPGTGPVRDGAPVAVVFLSDPVRRPRLSQELITPLFGLTPTEAEIALELAQGYRREEIAGRLGISHTTVAFHIRNIFQKTGTNRQADLVAMILLGVGAIQPAA